MHRARTLAALLVLGAALLAGAAAGAQEPATLSLSLQDALALAAKKSFDVQVEKLTYDQYDMGLKAAQGVYDPLLSATWATGSTHNPVASVLHAGSGTAGLNSDQDTYNFGVSQASPWGQTFGLAWTNQRYSSNSALSVLDPSYDSDLQFTTTLPLLQGFGRKAADIARTRARLGFEAAGFQYAQGLRDTMLQVEQAYWDLVYARKSLDVSRSGLELAREFQTETASRIRAGVLAPIEQVTADAQVALREQDILVAESLERNTEDILRLALGITLGTPEWDQRVVPTDEPSRNTGAYVEADLIRRAEERRPEILTLQKSVERAKADTAWAKNLTLPRLDLSGTLSYAGAAGDYFTPPSGPYVSQNFADAWDQITGLDYRTWSVGLAFKYPLFNRAAKYNFQTYRLAQNATEIQLEKTKQIVANDVRLSLRNLQTTEKRIAAAELSVRLQQEKLDAEKKKFQNGLSTAFNVLSYQNDLTAAQNTLLKARIDNQLAQADLDRAVGTYLESKGLAPATPAPAQAQ